MQFIGRFHPLAVHLPIALIVLTPILELAGGKERFSYLRLSVPFVLSLALAGAVAAAFLGWSLARSGGFSGPLVTQHMWGAAAVLALCLVCWNARAEGSRWRRFYPIALATMLAAVAFTGYRGGQLSFGESHLTEFLPSLFGSNSSPEPIDPKTFYGARIQPIFTERCLSCHSAAKRKGGLQLTGYGALMGGGKHGPAVKAGDTSGSELLRRISLAPSDDDFMPKGKPPLSADQINLIEIWINAGASGAAPLDSISGAGTSTPARAPQVVFPEVNPSEVLKQRAELAPSFARLQAQFPGVLDYLSRDSADLTVNASLLGDKFGDKEMAAMAPLASHIVAADFSGTAITDKSSASLSGMKLLRSLRLMHTKIGDATVAGLVGLDQLESVSVFDTRVTPGVLPRIASMPHLKHFYAGETGISAGALPPALRDKVVF